MEKGRRPALRHTGTRKKRAASSTRSNRLSRADMAALRGLDDLLERQRRQEQLAAKVPPEVTTKQLHYADGTVLFCFSHNELGDLGQLRIRPVPPYMAPIGGCVVQAEIFPDDPSDVHWDAKYRLFDLLVTVCVTGLPGEGVLHAPLPPLAEAKEQRRLYLDFIACQHADALRAWVEVLTAEQYHLLLAGLQQARATASHSDQDLAGILQRQDDLRRLWAELHQDWW